MTFLRGNPPCVRQIREGAARGVNRTRNSAMLVADSANSVKAPFLGPPNGSGGGNHRDSQSCVGLGSSAPSASHRSAAPWSAADPTNSARRSGALASPPGTPPDRGCRKCRPLLPCSPTPHAGGSYTRCSRSNCGPRLSSIREFHSRIRSRISSPLQKEERAIQLLFRESWPSLAANTHGRAESRCSASCPLRA